MECVDYLISRSTETGSWLGQSYQGQGIGTAMRQVICAFAFDCLDADEVRSSALIDNQSSQGASRNVGDVEDDTDRERLNDGLAVLQRFRLTADDLIRHEHPLSVEGLDPLRRSIGLGASTEETESSDHAVGRR